MRQINVQLNLDEPVTSEMVFEALRSITGQDCVAMANLNVDEDIWLNGSIQVTRPE